MLLTSVNNIFQVYKIIIWNLCTYGNGNTSWLGRFESFTQFWNFKSLFLQIFFQPYFFFFSFHDSEATNIRSFVIVPQFSEFLCVFFKSVFFHCWINFSLLYLEGYWFFSVTSILLLGLFVEFSIGYTFFSCKISICCFFILFLCWMFLFF